MSKVTTTRHNGQASSYDIQLDGEGHFPIEKHTRPGRDLGKYFGYYAGADQRFHRVSPGVKALLSSMIDDVTKRPLIEYLKES